MKPNITLAILLFLIPLHLCAKPFKEKPSKKHTITFDLHYQLYAKPTSWHHNDKIISLNDSKDVKEWLGASLVYSLHNRYGIRLNSSYLYQGARYINPQQTPPQFLVSREMQFTDITVGYNFLNRTFDNLESWLYIGAGYGDGMLETLTYVSGSTEPIGGSAQVYNWYPVAQLLFQYYPLKCLFIGIGGTYRYVPTRGPGHDDIKSFQTFNLELSIGVKFGVFNKKSR